MQVTIDDILKLLGAANVELSMLRTQLEQVRKELATLKNPQTGEDPKDAPHG
jgi:hypothetical protein